MTSLPPLVSSYSTSSSSCSARADSLLAGRARPRFHPHSPPPLSLSLSFLFSGSLFLSNPSSELFLSERRFIRVMRAAGFNLHTGKIARVSSTDIFSRDMQILFRLIIALWIRPVADIAMIASYLPRRGTIIKLLQSQK